MFSPIHPLNVIIHSPNIRLIRAAAVLLTLGLFTLGSITHRWAYFSRRDALGGASCYLCFDCLHLLPWLAAPVSTAHCCLGSVIGVIHEVTEIITHSHGFEIKDVMVNALGVLIGVLIQRATIR